MVEALHQLSPRKRLSNEAARCLSPGSPRDMPYALVTSTVIFPFQFDIEFATSKSDPKWTAKKR